LDTLNGTFHSICEFDVENKADKQIDTAIMRINNLIDQQLTIDTGSLTPWLFTGFVNKNEFNISNEHMEKKGRMAIYEKATFYM